MARARAARISQKAYMAHGFRGHASLTRAHGFRSHAHTY